jgi:uncharacterized membrane protein YbaN (DUF454 family)
MKVLFIAIGTLATGLAILGAILPGLPTTPFLLVALWAFARSSPRLHGWLRTMPLMQSALREAERFEQERSMHWRVKLFAFTMAWGSAALTAFVWAPERPMLIMIVAGVALAGTIFLISVRTDWD